MKQMLEMDVVIQHPTGVTEAMKQEIENAVIKAAEGFGGSVGGSFDLVDEPTDEGRKHALPYSKTN